MSTIFQKLFGPVNSKEQEKMIDDELPINDPDEMAVEEEFKNKSVSKQPPEPPVNPPVKNPPPKPKSETPAQNIPQPTVPQRSPAPTRQNNPKPQAAVPPAIQPTAPRASVSSSPDMDRLRNIAKSSGLSTSMDSLGMGGDGMMFDIEVLEEGEDGRPMVHVERGVSASSEAELRELYAMSDQKIRIIRKYGEQSPAPTPASRAPIASEAAQERRQVSSAPISHEIPEKINEPPKYFNVSGVECKLENGKVYQRQWVRLAGADAESFRLVNDANNKIVPIDGKHIEQKKWVLIQENADEGE